MELCSYYLCEVNVLQLQVNNSPFNQEQTDLLNRLVPTLTESQKIWLSGYLSAITPSNVSETPSTQTSLLEQTLIETVKEITILYGSQTGNAHSLAKTFGKRLK